MLRTFTAIEFVQPADRGTNMPMLIHGEDEDGNRESIFLKSRAGYANRENAPGIELFTALLARELGLPSPEPVAVEMPEEFHRQVFDKPEYRALLAASAGLNFGTISLGPDWKTWPVDMSTRAFAPTLIDAIFIFDALVQQTDREMDNPNLMWRKREIAILDHEKCFAYVGLPNQAAKPWHTFFMHRPLRTHCLRTAVTDLEGRDFGREMWGNFLDLDLTGRLTVIEAATVGVFPTAALAVGRISAYVAAVFRDIQDFLDHVKDALTR